MSKYHLWPPLSPGHVALLYIIEFIWLFRYLLMVYFHSKEESHAGQELVLFLADSLVVKIVPHTVKYHDNFEFGIMESLT